MVIHGRDEEARSEVFQFLRAIGLRPLEWSQLVALTDTGAPYVGQVLDAAFRRAAAALVVLTPDDEVRLRPGLSAQRGEVAPSELQARPNVFFEAGLAFGHAPTRTILLEVGRMRAASDLGGRHVIRVDTSGDWRHELARRLTTAGCAVDTSGQDWLRLGRFETATTAEASRWEPPREATPDRSNPYTRATELQQEFQRRQREAKD